MFFGKLSVMCRHSTVASLELSAFFCVLIYSKASVKWLNKHKKHSLDNGQVQGLKMSGKSSHVQRKTLIDLQKAWRMIGQTTLQITRKAWKKI